MLDPLSTVIAIVGGIIGIILGIRTVFRKPKIKFSLQRYDISISNTKQEVNISLLCGLIGNKNTGFLGETARKITGGILFRGPVENTSQELNASAELPWMESFGKKVRVNGPLESEEDIQKALESYLFNRKSTDIPQGRGETLTIVYGIEISNKLFIASNPPIEIPLPEQSDGQWKMHGFFFRLELAGDNVPSIFSEGSVVFGDSWTNWSVPAQVSTIYTPSKINNILLKFGIGKKIKVIDTESEA